MSVENIIEMKNLYKSYYLETGEEVPVLKGIDLKIKQNEFIAIMGESGSGKSTLLNIIGFLHSLTSGEYILEGDDVSKIKDDETLSFIRSKKIGFIFQQFYLLPRLNSLENITLPAIYAGVGFQNRNKKALELLQKLGLQDKIKSYPGELSGGQQQRIAIGRSLINSPEILLADEPTGNLDSKTTSEVMDLIKEVKTSGKTVIMVTHAKNVALYADRIIFLKDGKVIDDDYKLDN